MNSQEVLWTDALELKDIFHSYGVNFKLLPRIYEGIGSKQVKKYMQSVMAAKVAKDQVYDTLIAARREKTKVRVEEIVEDYVRMLMEGNNSNSSEVWKELTRQGNYKNYQFTCDNLPILLRCGHFICAKCER